MVQFLVLIALSIITIYSKDCYLWGTYKPHLFYHYQEQEGLSFGLMYSKSGLNIPLRFRYSNTDFFSNYQLQDFQGTIHSQLKDHAGDMELDIKTINNCDEYWQTQIEVSQGYQLPPSFYFKGYSSELVLYFYSHQPDEEIIISKSEGGLIVNFQKAKKIFRVKLMNDQNDILASQTIYYPYSTLWKTDQIYNRYTYKKLDILTGSYILSQEKKLKENNAAFQDAFKYKYEKKQFYRQNTNGFTLANTFMYQAQHKCALLQIHNIYEIPQITQEEKDNQKENIAFIQLTTKNLRQTIVIEYIGRDDVQEIENFDQEFQKRKSLFEQKVTKNFLPYDIAFFNQKQFQTRYTAGARGFQAKNYDIQNTTLGFLKCLKQTISNILGGIVYYKGKIMRSDRLDNEEKIVFSASPSRSLFPRGFLWDDGFQLVPVCSWDKQLCKRIILNWMNLMDEDGWIAREQARGEEIKSHIPFKFVTQDPKEANPPTLLLPIRMIINEVARSIKKIKELIEKQENQEDDKDTQELINQYRAFVIEELGFIKQVYPKLKLWKSWFEKTQSYEYVKNDSKEESSKLRWRCKGGCDSGLFLGSGMDDYPRITQGAALQEHLDLKCWMLLFDNTFGQIELIIGETSISEDIKDEHYLIAENHFESYKQSISDMYTHFQDPEDLLFKDYATRKNFLYGSETIHNYELGYVNLFPMFFGSLNSSTVEWKTIIRLLKDKNQLWSAYGIRSLSKRSVFYGTGEDYWRGAIWMPINYLVIRGLRLYSQDDESQKLYYSLRENIILNIYKNWEDTGFMFENYNGDTGLGQRAFPFDGWTGAVFLALCSETFE